MDSRTGILINREVLTLSKMEEYLCQLIWCIIVKMNGLGKPALQSWIGINEVMHLVSITCHDTDKLTSVILKTFQQRINSLRTKGITII